MELRPGLLKACRDERAMFCKDVVPGQARVFRCASFNSSWKQGCSRAALEATQGRGARPGARVQVRVVPSTEVPHSPLVMCTNR